MFPGFSQIKKEARDGLQGLWARSIGRELLHALIAGGATPVSILVLLYYSITALFSANVIPEEYAFIARYGFYIFLIAAIISFVRLVVGCGIRMSLDRYYYSLADNPERNPDEPLFGQMKYSVHRFFMEFRRDICISLLSLLFVFPGVIHGLKWAFASYIQTEKPYLTGGEILTEASVMIEGYKMKFFLFTLSFIPWFILGIFSFGIGFIWITPYYNAAKARFYHHVKYPQWIDSKTENEFETLRTDEFSYEDFVDEFESKMGK